MQKRCVMKKRKIDHYSFLPVVGTEEAVRAKCIKGLVAWSTRPISKESFPDDFPDGFHLHDWTGSGSPEARAGRLEQNLAPAPCRELLEFEPAHLESHLPKATNPQQPSGRAKLHRKNQRVPECQ